MGVGRGGRGALAPSSILKISTKKVVFLVSRGKNQISPLLGPAAKILKTSPGAPPLEKIYPTPMVTEIHQVDLSTEKWTLFNLAFCHSLPLIWKRHGPYAPWLCLGFEVADIGLQ